MKPIPLQISENEYAELEAIAQQSGQPLLELVRQLLSDFLQRKRGTQGSIFDVAPHQSGPMLRGWSRAELLDELLDR